jgi:hypothetical protein
VQPAAYLCTPERGMTRRCRTRADPLEYAWPRCAIGRGSAQLILIRSHLGQLVAQVGKKRGKDRVEPTPRPVITVGPADFRR